MKRALQFVAFALCARAAIATATAQSIHRGTRFEIVAGANFADLTMGGETDHRTGLFAGIGIVQPIASGWNFAPELTYSMKGAKPEDRPGGGTLEVDYIEVPLLFRYQFWPDADGGPFFILGPTPAFNVRCDGDVNAVVAQPRGSCSDHNLDTHTFDVGLMGGAGFAFHYLNHVITVGGRYNYGLIDVFDHAGSSHNRVWSVVGTLDFPWINR
jgi:hypothetical protein